MNQNDATDEQLVQRFREGDNTAFDALVRRFEDRIYRLAIVWIYDPDQAEDAAQEVFLRSYKGLRSFRFRSTVYTWLYRTTRNVCHEFNRRRRHSSLELEPPDSRSGPAHLAANAQTARRVRQLVATLPERQKEVVMLRIFEELSVRDTAVLMGCREGTVKALLYKATQRLRIEIDELGITL